MVDNIMSVYPESSPDAGRNSSVSLSMVMTSVERRKKQTKKHVPTTTARAECGRLERQKHELSRRQFVQFLLKDITNLTFPIRAT